MLSGRKSKKGKPEVLFSNFNSANGPLTDHFSVITM